jgi:putative transposase
VQTGILHLIRNTSRYASKRDWDALARDLKPIYTAVNEQAAGARFDEFTQTWGQQYPAIIKLWRSAWSEFVPFLDYDVEIHRVICSTNAQRPLPPRHQDPRAPPHRAGRSEVPSTWSPDPSTPPDAAGHDGSHAGNQHSTPSPSHSKAA